MNIQAINEQTAVGVAAGFRVLQIHRFAENDFEHVTRLAKWADLPQNAYIADLGCGIGEVAKIFKELRPDLTFCLVNLSEVQLTYAPVDMKQHCCNFCDVPEKDKTFDAALFFFSIGHSDTILALKEAQRILKSGAPLVIYDMTRKDADNAAMLEVNYEVHRREVMEQKADEAGFKLDFYLEPHDDGQYGNSMIGELYGKLFNGTKPAFWRFIKC